MRSQKNGHILASQTVHGRTYALFENILQDQGINFSVEMTDLKAVEADFEFREKNRIAKDTNFFL